jgi:glucose-6-phosphate dehydrogenase assembly protein OpcA
MIQDLTDTVASKVAAAFVEARHRAGIPAIGMVGTLIIVTGEAGHYDALRAAQEAAREHPARILVVIARPGGKGKPRLDAEVRFLGDSGPGETGVLRLHGELADHAESVLLPLLLPDAPVIVWWPGEGPAVPGVDPVGNLATRRITDTAACSDPLAMLTTLRDGYQPGDTDLAWTRLTSWRTVLAATLDQPFDPITSGKVACEAGSPSAVLLSIWLRHALGVPIEQEDSEGPGITEVRLATTKGDIVLSRPDGRLAHLSRPGQPEREVALHQRDTVEIISEEMRRLDPDEVYAESLAQVGQAG